MSKHNRAQGTPRRDYQEERPAAAAAVPENPTADASPIPTISEQTTGAADNAEASLSNEPAAANDSNGWKPIGQTVTEIPPRNGMPVYLSDKPEGAGVLAFWKKTRAFANATKKWDTTGRWTDFMSGLPIAFEPKYWRERFAT